MKKFLLIFLVLCAPLTTLFAEPEVFKAYTYQICAIVSDNWQNKRSELFEDPEHNKEPLRLVLKNEYIDSNQYITLLKKVTPLRSIILDFSEVKIFSLKGPYENYKIFTERN